MSHVGSKEYRLKNTETNQESEIGIGVKVKPFGNKRGKSFFK
jgi:hypothetical protein